MQWRFGSDDFLVPLADFWVPAVNFPGCNGWLPNFFSLLLGWFCVSGKIEANL